MADNRSEEFQPVAGEEIGPARVKLLGMLLLSLLIIPAGAVAAFLWWYQVELFGGRVLTAKAGIAGLLAVPFGALLAIVGVVLLISAKRLVIAEECLQLLSRGRVVIQDRVCSASDRRSPARRNARDRRTSRAHQLKIDRFVRLDDVIGGYREWDRKDTRRAGSVVDARGYVYNGRARRIPRLERRCQTIIGPDQRRSARNLNGCRHGRSNVAADADRGAVRR